MAKRNKVVLLGLAEPARRIKQQGLSPKDAKQLAKMARAVKLDITKPSGPVWLQSFMGEA